MDNSGWEYGIDTPQSHSSDSMVTYTDESVMRYRADSIEELLSKPKKILDMIVHHRSFQVPRLDILDQYYKGNNPVILSGNRRKENDKSDHRVRHSFAGVISDFLNTYVLSNSVRVEDVNATTGEDGEVIQSDFMELIQDFNIANDIDAHNMEIGMDQNNQGRAYELLVRTHDDRERIYMLDPREVFMIYDKTVASRVIGAVRYYPENELDQSKFITELYTPLNIYRFRPHTLNARRMILDEEATQAHLFNGVPIIEYRSDRFRMSVYEKQLPLIDAYDSAQSDTANYMTDFNDAILAIEGYIANADDKGWLKAMKDANLLYLIPEEGVDGSRSNVKASYLTKSYDVAGVEAYKGRLKEDIFSLSAIPNLSDESFSGNKSGEALKYKLFGLQQKRSDKEKYLAKGFRVRYKLLENMKRNVNEFTGEQVQLKFSFSPNLPTSYLEELKTYIDAGGTVSQKTMLNLLSFVDDVSAEESRIREEESAMRLPDTTDSW